MPAAPRQEASVAVLLRNTSTTLESALASWPEKKRTSISFHGSHEGEDDMHGMGLAHW